MSSIQAAGSTPDFYYCLTDDFIDKKVIAFVKESVLSKTHFENVIEETNRAYREEDQKTRQDNSRLEKRFIEEDEKLIKNYIVSGRKLEYSVIPAIFNAGISSFQAGDSRLKHSGMTRKDCFRSDTT